jgi:hypothetical protein
VATPLRLIEVGRPTSASQPARLAIRTGSPRTTLGLGVGLLSRDYRSFAVRWLPKEAQYHVAAGTGLPWSNNDKGRTDG